MIAHEVVEKIKPIFEDRLKKVILFGSYARGDYDGESDIDIMVMVDDDEINLKKYMNYFEEIYELR